MPDFVPPGTWCSTRTSATPAGEQLQPAGTINSDWTAAFSRFPMPKQKTHKGTKKRFRATANGKVKHRSAGTSHLAAGMSKKRRRNLRGTAVVNKVEAKKLLRLLAGNSY